MVRILLFRLKQIYAKSSESAIAKAKKRVPNGAKHFKVLSEENIKINTF